MTLRKYKIIQYVGFIIYVILKYTIIGGILLDIVLIIIKSWFFVQINDVLCLNTRKKTLHQSINFRMYCKVWRNDYYKKRYAFAKMIKNYSLDDLRNRKFSKYHNSVFKCKTNEIIYKHFLSKLSNILIDYDSKIISPQPLEKLRFINSIVLWKNTFNSNFWKFIFQKETIQDYYFKI